MNQNLNRKGSKDREEKNIFFRFATFAVFAVIPYETK